MLLITPRVFSGGRPGLRQLSGSSFSRIRQSYALRSPRPKTVSFEPALLNQPTDSRASQLVRLA